MDRLSAAGRDEAAEAIFELETMRSDVARGLLGASKSLPPKYFYDARGSALFNRITRLPEYYLTDAERDILTGHAAKIIDVAGRPLTFVELGPGRAEKSRILIDAALRAAPRLVYVPVDVSQTYLHRLETTFAGDYEELEVRAVRSDFTRQLVLPADLPRPALHALLGSSIGNFPGSQGESLVQRIREQMGSADTFLLGVDLHKDRRTIEAAYNDADGVTAAFNRNILHVLNARLGADFDPDAFEHRAHYDERKRRIEMRLVARTDQRVRVPGIGEIVFGAGESILTEYSRKYDRESVEDLLGSAGLRTLSWLTDEAATFALALSQP